MSLTFAQATTNKVTVTNPLTIGSGSELTYITLVKQSAAPANSQGTGKGGLDLFTYFSNWFIEVPRATTNSSCIVADAALFPTLNEWVFFVATYSEAGGSDIYRGTLTAAPVLLTTTSRTVGSGATTANTGDLWINNRSATSALAPAHTNSYVQLLNKKLTLAEITRLWRGLRTDVNTKLLLNLGNNGTGTQNDLSGNLNNGTVTGATQSANAPLRKARRVNAFVPYIVASGAQTLTATKFTNTSTFGAHTLTPGAVTLTTTKFSNASTFGTQVLTNLNTLSATKFTNTSVFRSPAISVGAVTLTPTKFTNTSTFGTHVLTQVTNQTLTATKFSNVSTFGAHTLGGGETNTFSQDVEIRKFYMRKGKKLLMFDSVAEAEAYTQAEALADEAMATKTSRLARKRLRTRITGSSLPAQTIDTDWLAEMMQRFAINLDLPALLAEQDYERVMQIHAMAMKMQDDDEEDIELLLLMG